MTMEKRLVDANSITCENTWKEWSEDHGDYVVCTAPTVLSIPENPTNGDMIKAMFPNAEIFRREEYGYQYVLVTIQDMGNSWKIRGEWWDAKYKGGN